MTIETDISGDASGLISLGSWLSAAPGDAVSGAGDTFAYARSLIGSEWQGTTADAFVSAAGRSVRDCDELGDMITSISSAITDYGYALASVQGKMTNIRAQAADEGLTVSGTTISGSSGLGVWSGAQSVSEASGVDEGSGDVVGGVAESLGDAS